MERGGLTRLIDRIEFPLFLACGATGAGLQERVWWGFTMGVVALAAVLFLVWTDRRALARGAVPRMGLDDYRRLVRLLWWAVGMVLAGSMTTVIVHALVSAVRGTG